MKIRPEFTAQKKLYAEDLDNKILTREDFIQELKSAVKNRSGFAGCLPSG
ncbi:MAG: hypothetical protein JXB26_03740 [Candidatus Aminicenantes bacterium]|nr:hypothetical protein [Candidatus Aminicenantes bacterium]